MDRLTEQEPEPPHSHRLRTNRVTLRSAVYLITSVTSKRRPIFTNIAAADCVTGALRHYHDRGNVHSFAWVVMPDHIHWLLQLRVGTLEWLLRAFKTWTSAQVRRCLSTPPRRIWQPGFHDRLVRPHEKLEPYIGYVVANPVRRGLVREIRDYPYSFAEMCLDEVVPVMQRPWTG
ncbi:MAG: transposase [Xanthomonadaceae bacterium]|nr:transposase [Xanthomonadaceae bacterium]